MKKRKSNLREYERNNRVINIEQAGNDRRERLLNQKEKKEKKPSRMKLVVCAVIIILIVYFGVSAIKIIQLNQEKAEVESYNQELAKKKENLELQIENINSPDYMESLARKDLKLVKPNELLFIFPEKDYEKNEEQEQE